LFTLSLCAFAPSSIAAPALQEPAGQREAVQPPPPAAQPTVPGAWARYLPPRTIALVSARSTDAVLKVGEQVAAAVGQPMGLNPNMLWAMVLPFECDASLIDPAREVHLALVLEAGAFEPAPCFFLPSADPVRLAASVVPDSGFTATAQEGYAIVSNAPLSAQPSAAPHALASQLLQGQVAVQVDLETLITTFRPMIDMGLMQAESMLEGGLDEMQGMVGMQGWFRESVDFAREALDVSQGLGFALRLEERELEIDARYTMEEGSSFAGMHGNKVRALGAHRDLLDPQASMIALSNFDYELYAAPLLALTSQMLEPLSQMSVPPQEGMASEEGLKKIERMLAVAKNAMPMYGTLQAWSADVDATRGMSFEMHTRGAAPEKLAGATQQWLEWMKLAEFGVGFDAAGVSEREVAGRKLLQGRLNLDTDQLEAWQSLTEEERAQAKKTNEMIAKMLYPEGSRLSIGQRADELLIVQGDDARLNRALARGAAPARFEPAFERALARCGSISPAIASQVDVARLTSWVFDFMRLAFQSEGAPPGMSFETTPVISHPFWLTSWAALGATDCSGGLHLDLDELGHYVESWMNWMEEMQGGAPPEPQPFTYEIK